MDIEKTLTLAAPADQVWGLLLDPHAMGGCVPGMQSIEVLGEDEYIALMQVKISFISARFRLKTRIVERRAPHYLRTEGTGEDASVASSLKQHSEIFLDTLPDGQTALRMKVRVDVMGRLGSFGLNVMKTKADRLWDEFGRNLAVRLAPEPTVAAETPAAEVAAPVAPGTDLARAPMAAAADHTAAVPPPQLHASGLPQRQAPGAGTWWARLWGRAPVPSGRTIHVEIQRGDTTIRVDWPLEQAQACADWLLQVQAGR